MSGDIANAATTLSGALQVAKPVVETSCRLLESLLGEPCKIAGAMLADQVYFWQWTNRIRLLERAKQIMDAKHIEPRELPPSLLIPLLESAGNTDEPEVQEMFANLLASSVADDNNCHPAFANIIAQLSRDEALIVSHLTREPIKTTQIARIVADNYLTTQSIVESTFDVGQMRHRALLAHLVEHLKNLGLVIDTMAICISGGLPPLDDNALSYYMNETHLTDFGRLFTEVCVLMPHTIKPQPPDSSPLPPPSTQPAGAQPSQPD